MKHAIVVLLGALGLVACAKERPAQTVTTTAEQMAPAVAVEEVRAVLLEKRPHAREAINALIITSDEGIVTLRGKVEDEASHSDLVNRVRAMPNVRGVRDELQVHPRAMVHPERMGEPGTTTTTGAPTGGPKEGEAGEQAKPSKVDAVRHEMKKARPKDEAIIVGLTITEDGDIVTITGIVPDEPTRQGLVRAAKRAPGVKGVKDDLKVQKKP